MYDFGGIQFTGTSIATHGANSFVTDVNRVISTPRFLIIWIIRPSCDLQTVFVIFFFSFFSSFGFGLHLFRYATWVNDQTIAWLNWLLWVNPIPD